MAIFYRLKTECQWRQLPMKQFFRGKYSWQSVYYHFQKLSEDGNWGRGFMLLYYGNFKQFNKTKVIINMQK